MRKSLIDYSEENPSRKGLCDCLTPRSRDIILSPMQYPNTIAAETHKLLSFMKNATEQQAQPMCLLIHSKRKTILSYKFPYFGPSKPCESSAEKVAILLYLLRCILVKSKLGEKSTIRDIFYLNVELFRKQQVVSDWLRIIQEAFELPSRDCLQIVAAQKGLCHTPVALICDNSHLNENNTTLIPYMKQNCDVSTDWTKIKRVIVLEKDAIFNKLIRTRKVTFDTLVVSGKGYPDFLTRLFLNRLMNSAPSSVLFEIFVDSDPYGIDIATKYTCNLDNRFYECPRLRYRGVFIHELLANSVNITGLQLLPLTLRDAVYARNLLKKLATKNLENWNTTHFTRELQRQLFFCKKAEMNTVANCTFEDYFLEKKNKLGRAGN